VVIGVLPNGVIDLGGSSHNATTRLEVTYTELDPALLPYLPRTVWAAAASVSAQAVEELFEF
jgi:hypothetical protein